MPSSQFGHSHQGINVANFRILQQDSGRNSSSLKKEPAYRTPYEWQKETAEQCAIGNDEQKLSSSLRITSNVMQNSAARQVEQDLGTVENALRDKISHTDQLRAALSHALDEILAEIQQLVMLRANMEERLGKVQSKLELNSARTEVRRERPGRENTMDSVQRQLNNQAAVVSNFEAKTKRAIDHLNNEIAQLDRVRNQLTLDRNDKMGAINVDHAVLNISTEGADNPVLSKKYDTLLKTPHSWARSTEENIKLARHWLADSVRLRKAVKYAIQNSREVEHSVSKELNSCMMSKLAATTALKGDLERQLDEVRAEQARAISTRSSLADALAAKRGPLQQAKDRLNARKARPEREHVQDKVEAALANEIANLNAITKQLSLKISAVDKEITQLGHAASMLESNIRDKSSAMMADQRVALMDGRVSLTTAPPSSVFTSASNASCSPRTQTLRRIQMLEGELSNARREREGLERSILELKGVYS